jgi:transcriptional regulator with XRE-family HTH domain
MEGRIGERVAALRNARGLTQRALADRASISYSLLTKVESGHKPASPAVIGALARALRVDVPRLTGQPYENTGRGGRSARLKTQIEPLRRAIASIDYPSEDARPRPVDELAEDVAAVSRLGQKADYVRLADTLPTLLEDLAIALADAPDDEAPRLQSLLAEAYSGASAISNLLGYLDLRDRVIDRIERAAQVCDEPLRVQRVQWQRGQSLMAIGAYGPALALAKRGRSALGDDPVRMDQPTRSVYGSLHLRSAILCARASKTEGVGRAHQAWDHLAQAREVADLMGEDRDDFGLAFGPSNVSQHEVSVAVELEQGATAIELSRGIRLGEAVPVVRRGHHYIDLSRGFLMEGSPRGALHCLQIARRIAPQQTRHHPMVRETVLAIASATRGSEELTSFAGWLGIG